MKAEGLAVCRCGAFRCDTMPRRKGNNLREAIVADQYGKGLSSVCTNKDYSHEEKIQKIPHTHTHTNK